MAVLGPQPQHRGAPPHILLPLLLLLAACSAAVRATTPPPLVRHAAFVRGAVQTQAAHLLHHQQHAGDR